MPRLQTATLCNAASTEATGLVSMLGAFVDQIMGPELPVRQQLWFVARLTFDEEDYNQQLSFTVRVDGPSDEQVARVDGSGFTEAPGPDVDPDLPAGANVVLPLLLEFRHEAVYWIRFLVNGDELWSTPLKVKTTLPRL